VRWVTKMKNSGLLASQKNYELSLIIFLDNFTRVSRSAFGFPLLIALLATRCGSLNVRSSATPSPRAQVACGNCFQLVYLIRTPYVLHPTPAGGVKTLIN